MKTIEVLLEEKRLLEKQLASLKDKLEDIKREINKNTFHRVPKAGDTFIESLPFILDFIKNEKLKEFLLSRRVKTFHCIVTYVTKDYYTIDLRDRYKIQDEIAIPVDVMEFNSYIKSVARNLEKNKTCIIIPIGK